MEGCSFSLFFLPFFLFFFFLRLLFHSQREIVVGFTFSKMIAVPFTMTAVAVPLAIRLSYLPASVALSVSQLLFHSQLGCCQFEWIAVAAIPDVMRLRCLFQCLQGAQPRNHFLLCLRADGRYEQVSSPSVSVPSSFPVSTVNPSHWPPFLSPAPFPDTTSSRVF